MNSSRRPLSPMKSAHDLLEAGNIKHRIDVTQKDDLSPYQCVYVLELGKVLERSGMISRDC